MFNRLGLTTLRCAALAAGLAACLPALAQNVDAILKKADAFRMLDTAAQVEVRVQTMKEGRPDKEKHYQVLSKPGGKSLVLFRSPGEIGQKVLMVGDDFWMLLPGSARPIRITPLQKLLGEASTGDIATMTWSGDYAGSVVRELDVDGVPCLELDLAALRKSVTYQRVVLQVAKRDYRPLHADLYASSNRKLKQARFTTELREGRPTVVRMVLNDEIQSGRDTVVDVLGTKARELGDEIFNPMYLGRSNLAP